ncbi:MAG: PEGA domain-containing protein [Candidatus Omnitrophica bacterium]|nr:PEGA domain-containing protein [Candidatus Omnitrophota bacterium]
MLYLRKTLLFSFIAAYLILCPLLLLYSFGRIMRPGGEGDLAGLIFLSSSPPGATIHVEGRRFTEKTPAALSGMLPGSYDVTLSLKNYKPWHYKITALPKLASVFDKILLIPQRWVTRELSSDSFQKLIPLSGSRFFILAKGPKLRDYYSFDSKSEALTSFVRSDSTLANYEVVSLFKIKESSTVIARVRNFNGEKYLLIEQDIDYVNVKDISRFFTGSPEHIIWEPGQSRYFFPFENNSLSKIDLIEQSLEADYIDNLRGYGLFNNKIYVLKEINTLFRINYARRNQKVLINDPILGKFLFGDKGFFEVKPLDEDLIIFLGEEGKLLSNHLPHRITESGVRGLEFHRKTKRVLFWMKKQAGIMDYRPLLAVDPTYVKTTPTKGYWFYTKGRDITQSFWAYQGTYIVLADADEVFIFELKAEGEAAPNQIIKIKTNSSVHYLEDNGKLYYLDALTKKLSCAEVIDLNRERPFSYREYLSKKR